MSFHFTRIYCTNAASFSKHPHLIQRYQLISQLAFPFEPILLGETLITVHTKGSYAGMFYNSWSWRWNLRSTPAKQKTLFIWVVKWPWHTDSGSNAAYSAPVSFFHYLCPFFSGIELPQFIVIVMTSADELKGMVFFSFLLSLTLTHTYTHTQRTPSSKTFGADMVLTLSHGWTWDLGYILIGLCLDMQRISRSGIGAADS